MANNKFTIGDEVYFGEIICKVVDILGYKTNNFKYDICELYSDGIYFDIPESELTLAY